MIPYDDLIVTSTTPTIGDDVLSNLMQGEGKVNFASNGKDRRNGIEINITVKSGPIWIAQWGLKTSDTIQKYDPKSFEIDAKFDDGRVQHLGLENGYKKLYYLGRNRWYEKNVDHVYYRTDKFVIRIHSTYCDEELSCQFAQFKLYKMTKA